MIFSYLLLSVSVLFPLISSCGKSGCKLLLEILVSFLASTIVEESVVPIDLVIYHDLAETALGDSADSLVVGDVVLWLNTVPLLTNGFAGNSPRTLYFGLWPWLVVFVIELYEG